VLVALDLPGRYALTHYLRETAGPEGARLNPRDVLDRHPATGAYVLSQTHCIEELDQITSDELAPLFAGLRKAFPFTMVDGLRAFDDTSMHAVDAADHLILVVTPDVPAVRSAARAARIFRRIGFGSDSLCVVVNRHSDKALVQPADIAKAVGVPKVHTIRNDFRLAERCMNEGMPVRLAAPGSEMLDDIDRLAASLGWRPAPPERPKKGLFSKLTGGG